MSGCHADRLRCVVCGNPDWHDRGGDEECTHCGLLVADPVALATAASAIPQRLAGGHAAAVAGDPWSLSAGGWRNAAWRFGYMVSRNEARPAKAADAPLALGIMARPDELADAAALIDVIGTRFARIVLAVDSVEPVPLPSVTREVETCFHPLAGDFAAQRNRVQDRAGDGWVLQLDCDERPEPALLDALGWLIAAADRDGLVSLGVPRRNLVDGAPSALWPDIQYRLNRGAVRFAGNVHERPVVPFERTSLALAGAIEHRLTRARVLARTRTYAAMSSDGARREDEARLLRGFDPIAER